MAFLYSGVNSYPLASSTPNKVSSNSALLNPLAIAPKYSDHAMPNFEIKSEVIPAFACSIDV